MANSHQPRVFVRANLQKQLLSTLKPSTSSVGIPTSFAWKSIHSAQQLIKQGIRVVIGNGEATDISTSMALSKTCKECASDEESKASKY